MNVISGIFYVLDNKGQIRRNHPQEEQAARSTEESIEIKIRAVYGRGHKGFDHYVEHFAHGQGLVGVLRAIPLEGLSFVSKNTWKPQTVRMPWKSIKQLQAPVSSGCLNFFKAQTTEVKVWYINQQKNDSYIEFYIEQPEQFAFQIEALLRQYKELQNEKEQKYKEHIVGNQLDQIPPFRFEILIRDIFQKKGYVTILTKQSADGGVDVILLKDGKKSIVQCKRYKGIVGEPILRDLAGTMLHEGAVKGFVVTTGEFSKPASKWAEGKNIELVDKYELAEWIKEYGEIESTK